MKQLAHRTVLLIILTLCFMTLSTLSPLQPVQATMNDDYEVRISDRNLRSILQKQCDLTIGSLAKLETFDNKDLPLSDLSGLKYCTGLKKIKICNSQLKDISVLAHMPNLTSLNLQNDGIKDITPLKSLVNLSELNLERNSIEDISSLTGLVNLKSLNLASNKITSISPIQNIINVTSINLAHNSLTDISALQVLHKNGGLRPGDAVNLEGNNINLGLGTPAGNCIQVLSEKKVIIRSEPQNRIQVKIDGRSIDMDVPPVIIEGRTLVPLRAIFEKLDASVNWDNRTKIITACKDNTTIILSVNNKVVRINGQIKILDVPATVVAGRTMVPARFVAETLGKKVSWDPATNSVLISEPAK